MKKSLLLISFISVAIFVCSCEKLTGSESDNKSDSTSSAKLVIINPLSREIKIDSASISCYKTGAQRCALEMKVTNISTSISQNIVLRVGYLSSRYPIAYDKEGNKYTANKSSRYELPQQIKVKITIDGFNDLPTNLEEFTYMKIPFSIDGKNIEYIELKNLKIK